MSDATHEDAVLVVQLAQLYAQMGGAKAAGWVWSDELPESWDDFKAKYSMASDEAGYLNTVAAFNETVATLWKHGLLNEELLSDWLAVQMTWERVRPLLVGMREDSGEARLWENFEALAAARSAPAPA
jgi:hypothetical protein